ncbi:MAG: hypothetical protein WCL16_08735 [bacterium]
MTKHATIQAHGGDIVLYRAKDGRTALDVRLEQETIWLSLNQIAALFDRDKSVVSRHLRNVFETKELDRPAVVAFFATTAADGKTYQVFACQAYVRILNEGTEPLASTRI